MFSPSPVETEQDFINWLEGEALFSLHHQNHEPFVLTNSRISIPNRTPTLNNSQNYLRLPNNPHLRLRAHRHAPLPTASLRGQLPPQRSLLWRRGNNRTPAPNLPNLGILQHPRLLLPLQHITAQHSRLHWRVSFFRGGVCV
jgi:hypothetical protein